VFSGGVVPKWWNLCPSQCWRWALCNPSWFGAGPVEGKYQSGIGKRNTCVCVNGGSYKYQLHLCRRTIGGTHNGRLDRERMNAIIGYVVGCIGLFGFAFGLKCYSELRKWARQCQGARIAIAYKRKVKLQAPLIEWLMWVNQLDKDKDSHGRVVYSIGGTSVAITKAVHPKRKRKWAKKPTPAQVHRPGPRVATGTWNNSDEKAPVG
jgi:hypothetical protein